MTINFRDERSAPLWRQFSSRGLMVWAYDKDGNPQEILGGGGFYANVKLNGDTYHEVDRNQFVDGGRGTLLYGNKGDWANVNALAAYVSVTFQGTKWQSVSVMAAGRYRNTATESFNIAEITGAAYIYPDSQGTGCEVVSPIHPPKPPVTIHMSAPDWDLGELPMDHGEKRFTDVADQLCFTYSGLSGDGIDVVVDAENQNGIVAHQYQLKDLADPTQIVPYNLVLSDGITDFTLPNQRNSTIKLNASGRTCLAPTFRTYVRPMLKKGTYSDVLTFTVTTKT
ncbi:hypothetical protein [Burkholderia plantarii]|uniref:hypothetical protein n=1 Tax=Burkholderia plantarii TaxID=41899 RepID=UPI0018DD1831|nr:hypothetical protein [Burkholderia plantarii]MBI0328348.1 hypothetical protein [Burkholderia plantarii]